MLPDRPPTEYLATDAAHRRLMRAAQGGDGAAYRTLLKSVTPLLRRYAARRYRQWDRAEVEDVVQDILLSLHLARATYDPERPFRPWLLAVARHRMADSARRAARRAGFESTVENLPETSGAVETNRDAEVPEANAEAMLLRRAIERLSLPQRRAIKLLKLREYSLNEVAALTGSSVAALKVTVHRAIKALRESARRAVR